jgi:hypothetical protein
VEAVERYSGRYGPGSEGESDLLDVLRGGSEQALAGDGEEASEAGVAVTVELFGVSEGTFDGLFPALVDALAPRGEPMDVDTFTCVSPDMADDQPGSVATRRARSQRTASAERRVTLVLAVTGTAGGGIGEQLTLRTAVAIQLGLIDEPFAGHHARTRRGWSAIAGDAKDPALLQHLGDS